MMNKRKKTRQKKQNNKIDQVTGQTTSQATEGNLVQQRQANWTYFDALKTVGKYALGLGLGSAAYYYLKRNKKKDIDQCKKYKVGDEHDKDISNETKKIYYIPGDNETLIREGCTLGVVPINDDILTHEDTTLIDLDLRLDQLTGGQTLQGYEARRYDLNCSTWPSDYNFAANFKQEDLLQSKADKIGNSYTITPSKKKKEDILTKYGESISESILCSYNRTDIKTIALKYQGHRSKEGVYELNIPPKDFFGMLNYMIIASKKENKNIYIHEFSCHYGDEFPKMITKLLAKHPDYNGNIIIKRNKKYNQKLTAAMECKLKQGKEANTPRNILYNEIMATPEYLVFKRDETSNCVTSKCVTENEARKILGGSYLKNLEYNNQHGLGDETPTAKCNDTAKAYEEYYVEYDKNYTKLKPTCNPLLNNDNAKKTNEALDIE